MKAYLYIRCARCGSEAFRVRFDSREDLEHFLSTYDLLTVIPFSRGCPSCRERSAFSCHYEKDPKP